MRRKRSEGESAPMTLGEALAAKVRCGRLSPATSDRHRRARGGAFGRVLIKLGVS